jgi:hypothetical protein
MINTRGGRFTNLRTIFFNFKAANKRRGFKSVMIPLLSEQQLGGVMLILQFSSGVVFSELKIVKCRFSNMEVVKFSISVLVFIIILKISYLIRTLHGKIFYS